MRRRPSHGAIKQPMSISPTYVRRSASQSCAIEPRHIDVVRMIGKLGGKGVVLLALAPPNSALSAACREVDVRQGVGSRIGISAAHAKAGCAVVSTSLECDSARGEREQ